MRLRSFGWAIALLCALAPTLAAGDALSELIERSGLDRQLGEFQSAVKGGVDRAHATNPRLKPDELRRLRESVARVYAPDRLRPRLRAELGRMLSPADIVATLAWIDSPTGERLAELEKKAGQSAARRRIEAAIRNGPPQVSKARSETLHQLIAATKTDEFAASLAIESAVGIAEGFAGAAAGSEQSRSFRTRMEAERARLVKQLHDQSYAVFVIAYADATDEELQSLLRFARSPEGARFHLYAAQAFETAAAQAARDLGADLGALPASAAPAR